MIKRGFVDIAEGQVHYRHAGQHRDGQRPLVMFHASPGSSKMVEPLIAQFSQSRRVIAPDTLGKGDSCAPVDLSRSILPYVDAHLRALDTLGIRDFDIYGSHTGGSIACEVAITKPERVGRMILDGMSVYSDEERDDMLRNYAPGVKPDINGAHNQWIWNFVRDTYLFWPWYRKGAAERRDIGLPSEDVLHDKVVEVIKAARTYHFPYQAAIAYPKTERLPLVNVPTLLTCAETDMLKVYFEKARALLPHAEAVRTPGISTTADLAKTVALMVEYLDRA